MNTYLQSRPIVLCNSELSRKLVDFLKVDPLNVEERDALGEILDTHVQEFLQVGAKEKDLIDAMSSYMPIFKRFVQAGGVASDELERLAHDYPSLYYFAGVLTQFASQARK